MKQAGNSPDPFSFKFIDKEDIFEENLALDISEITPRCDVSTKFIKKRKKNRNFKKFSKISLMTSLE